ncbi:hypothetical protein [Bacteroides intestinalis]|uniref:hypothetical protein n=1 Tax=Bacteroides intestinalis TaxID=329854 RepID=UPI00189D68AA|nr:hypothetical protein [Bacteroides intestinalis]
MNLVKERNVISFVIAFLPILNIYETGIIPLLAIGQLLLVYFLGRELLEKKTIHLRFANYLLYSYIITIFNWIRPNVDFIQSLSELLSLTLFFILLSFSIDYGNEIKVKKYLFILAKYSLLFFYIQTALSYVGIHIIGIIPGLPLANGSDPSKFYNAHLTITRFSSFFQEPSHYAEFMILILAFYLFKESMNRKNFIISILISVSVVLSQSAGGYILLLTCWLYWGYNRMKSQKRRGVFLLFLPVLITTIFFASQTEMVSKVLGRYTTLSFTPEISEYGYSSYVRLFRGYIPIAESSWFMQLFGQGLGTLLSFVKNNPGSEYLSITDYDPNWINSFQYIIFCTGILGGSIFFKKLFFLFRRTSKFGKCLFFVYLLDLLSAGMLMTAASLLFLFFMYKEYYHCKLYGVNNNSNI